MKKLLVIASIVSLSLATNAACVWSWWTGDAQADKTLQGSQLGLACECQNMKGAQIALVMCKATKVQGVQGSIGYSKTEKLQNGAQVAFVNVADKAALQFGLICFNKGGFLPVFPFFNFDKTMFGGGNK